MSKRLKVTLGLAVTLVFPLFAVLIIGKLIFNQIEKIDFDFTLEEE